MADVNAYGETHRSPGIIAAYWAIFAREQTRGSTICFLEYQVTAQKGIDRTIENMRLQLASGGPTADERLDEIQARYDVAVDRDERQTLVQDALTILSVASGIKIIAYDADNRLDAIYPILINYAAHLSDADTWPEVERRASEMKPEIIAHICNVSPVEAEMAINEAKSLIGTQAFIDKFWEAHNGRITSEVEAASMANILGKLSPEDKAFIIGGADHFDLSNPATLGAQLLPKVSALSVTRIEKFAGRLEPVYCAWPQRPVPIAVTAVPGAKR